MKVRAVAATNRHTYIHAVGACSAEASASPALARAMTATYKGGAINAIYEKWFLKPIPPKGLNLNIPMGDQFKKVVANPTDSGDPLAYK